MRTTTKTTAADGGDARAGPRTWTAAGAAAGAAGAQAAGLLDVAGAGSGSGEERGAEAVEADDPIRARRKTKDERAGPRKRRPRKHRPTPAASAGGSCGGDDKMREMFLDNMKNTQWFQSTISRFSEDYEVVCPNSWFGCTFSCMLKDLEQHLESCVFRQVPDTLDQVVEEFADVDFYSYDVVCPNAVLGCKEICSRENLAQHLASCPVNGISREKEWEERLEWRRSVILASKQERERRMHELSASNGAELSFGHLRRLYEEQTAMLQVVLHDEIVDFYLLPQQEALCTRGFIGNAYVLVVVSESMASGLAWCVVGQLMHDTSSQLSVAKRFTSQFRDSYIQQPAVACQFPTGERSISTANNHVAEWTRIQDAVAVILP